MRAAAQAAQHRRGLLAVSRLAEHVAVDDDDCVAADDDGIVASDRAGFLPRESLGVDGRRFARRMRLVDVGWNHHVLDADEAQQLAATRRRRREDDRRVHRSIQSVTGPSLTISTCMAAPNSPVSTRDAALSQPVDEPVVQGLRVLRARRVDEARATALHRVAVERELRHDEHRAADVDDRAIHLVLVVGEDAQADELLGHPLDVVEGVRVREADEHGESSLDRAGDTIAHAHAGARHALNENSHDCAGMSTQEASGDVPRRWSAADHAATLSDFGLLDDLDVDRDLHLGADRDAAGFERLVPVQAVVVPIDRPGETEAGALVPPRILAAPFEMRLELDLVRGAADRQVADDLKFLRARRRRFAC